MDIIIIPKEGCDLDHQRVPKETPLLFIKFHNILDCAWAFSLAMFAAVNLVILKIYLAYGVNNLRLFLVFKIHA